MGHFILSAFSDEYSPVFDEQIQALCRFGIPLMEIRGVDGQNVAEISTEKAKECRRKLDAAGLGLSAIGSPIGKIQITDPLDPHLDTLRRVIELAHILGTERIRMFSFYLPQPEEPDHWREEVLERLQRMIRVTESEDPAMKLCHENENGIWGSSAARCLEIQQALGGRIRCVFDPSNFISCGEDSYPYAYQLLRDRIDYVHIKDQTKSHSITPAGQGDGGIPQILEDLRGRGGDWILTLEPHLRVFSGLAGLEDIHTTHVENQYATAEESFTAAVEALRRYLD